MGECMFQILWRRELAASGWSGLHLVWTVSIGMTNWSGAGSGPVPGRNGPLLGGEEEKRERDLSEPLPFGHIELHDAPVMDRQLDRPIAQPPHSFRDRGQRPATGDGPVGFGVVMVEFGVTHGGCSFATAFISTKTIDK